MRPVGEVDDAVEADAVDEARGGDVEALLEGGLDADQAAVLAVGVLRRPALAGELDGQRRVLDPRGGMGDVALEGGGIDHRLEGAAGLAPRLGDAVELRGAVVASADVGEDAARRGRRLPRLEPLLHVVGRATWSTSPSSCRCSTS